MARSGGDGPRLARVVVHLYHALGDMTCGLEAYNGCRLTPLEVGQWKAKVGELEDQDKHLLMEGSSRVETVAKAQFVLG